MKLRTKFTASAFSLFAVAMFVAQPALALPSNLPPPSGAILDLDGQALPSSYQTYTVDFTAFSSTADITFAFRNDPSFTYLTNVAVTDVTNPNGNQIVNGTFLGTGDAISGWTYDNVYGAEDAGVAQNGAWYDGSVQAYDAIDQVIGTNTGDTYQISFSLKAAGDSVFSDLSTNGNVTGTGGNGNDVLVYAQSGLPPSGTVAEPGSLVLLGAGILALFLLRRQRTL